VLLAVLSLGLALSPEPLQRFQAGVFDLYQRLFPVPRPTSPVVIVAVDEGSLRELGQWPWPRTRVADLIRAIGAGKPVAIGLDLFFPEPDRYSPGNLVANFPKVTPEVAQMLMDLPTNDSIFAEALAASPVPVVLGISGEEDPDARFTAPPTSGPVRLVAEREVPIKEFKGYIGSLPVLSQAAKRHGLMNSGSPSAVVRRTPMIAKVGGAYFGSLGMETLRAGIGGNLTVRDAGMGLLQIEFGEARAVAQEDGSAWIRFGHHDESRFVGAYDTLVGKLAPDTFTDKVVLVGITGLGILDFKTTPLAESVPGVEVHAQIVENMIHGVALTRPRIMPRVEALTLIVLGFLFFTVVPRVRAGYGLALVLGSVVLVGVAGLVLFQTFGLLFDPVLPSMAALAVFGIVVVGTLANSEKLRRVLREQAARLAGELDAARRIQMGLLPNPAETFAGERRFQVGALLEPARTVGGDFYDCFMIGERHLFFVVADVSGKGLPAALFMASVKSHLKSAALRGGEVGAMLSRAAEEIGRENPELLFVTAFAGLLDVDSGELQYANAGHEPGYARRPNGAPERLSHAGGPPLCVMDGYQYPTWTRQLSPGEWLCMVTDGATEAMNMRREFFGSERLRTALGWMPADISPDELIRRLRDDVRRFAEGAEPPDDLTLLALLFTGR
jgi:serine phosphatase RsbU (regulator of sigma subunit)/CHASE2 domain-containing sensor protein